LAPEKLKLLLDIREVIGEIQKFVLFFDINNIEMKNLSVVLIFQFILVSVSFIFMIFFQLEISLELSDFIGCSLNSLGEKRLDLQVSFVSCLL
jgi:hypothetical protein